MKGVGESPSWSSDWRWAAIYSVCIYAIVLAFRLSFAGRWDHPELWVNGERLLATHDAYFWLAKAKGLGTLDGFPLAEATSLFHRLTGLDWGTIGFWAPAFMSAFVGIVCFLWGWLIAGRNAGVFAGLVGSLTPGFYYRSRLGYFDTDMFTLLMPMLVAWMLAYWASKSIKRGWFVAAEEETEKVCSIGETLWMSFAFGLATRFAGIWHQDIINVSILYFFMTAAVILLNGKSGKKVWAFYGLVIFLLAAFPGDAFGQMMIWPFTGNASLYMSIIISASLALLFNQLAKRSSLVLSNAWVCAGVFLAVVLATGIAQAPVYGVMMKLAGYFYPAGELAPQGNAAIVGPIFPSIMQSIIEAKLVPMSQILARGVFAPWLGWLALLSSAVVVFLRPAAVFLLPLIVLQLASVKLGIRFSMFGGAALFVCLGVSLYWLVDVVARRYAKRQSIGLCAQAVLGICFMIFAFSKYSELPLTPTVTKSHAEGLIELGKNAPRNGMVWSWWDWGYATQYYAGMATVVDGGKHAGRDVFPVAFVMSTDSARKANRMIEFSSQYPVGSGQIRLSPAKAWDNISRDKILETIDEQLAQADYPVKAPQYFVVTWKDLTISKWITYYGNWNLETGEPKESTTRFYVPGELGINFQRGAVQNRAGQGGLVSDIDVLDWNEVENTHYGLNTISMKLVPKTPYLIINKVTRQSLLVEKTAYDSVMFRLLLGDPDDPEISKYFKLVVDKLPFARIYEVVQN